MKRDTDADTIIQLVSTIFEDLQITYLIGGSVASGIHGVFRYTNDIDFVADVQLEHVTPLVEAFGDFYADEEMIRDAVITCSSFSVLHRNYSAAPIGITEVPMKTCCRACSTCRPCLRRVEM